MRGTSINRRNKLRAATVCALGALILVGVAPARADENDLDNQIFRGVLEGLGLRSTAPTIDYRERSPLVLPSNNTLPPPASAAVKDPNWPVDPEIKRQREIDGAVKKNPGRITGDYVTDDARVLTPDELNRGPRTTIRGGSNNGDPFSKPSTPAELGAPSLFQSITRSFSKEDETVKFTGEKERTSLIQPPTGYQTPAPDQPYGVTKSKTGKATNYYGNFGTVESGR